MLNIGENSHLFQEMVAFIWKVLKISKEWNKTLKIIYSSNCNPLRPLDVSLNVISILYCVLVRQKLQIRETSEPSQVLVLTSFHCELWWWFLTCICGSCLGSCLWFLPGLVSVVPAWARICGSCLGSYLWFLPGPVSVVPAWARVCGSCLGSYLWFLPGLVSVVPA